MKRTILFLAAAIALVMGAKAQQQTATLQRGNSTTYYYGQDAFKEAYNAANDGSIITLSAGYFNTVDSVMKQITIRGNGYTGDKTVIGTNQFEGKMPYSVFICTDNVKMEGLYLERALTLNEKRTISGLKISRCYIQSLIGPNYYIPTHSNIVYTSNIIIDQCKIGIIHLMHAQEPFSFCIKNSYIDIVRNCNNLQILNSVIGGHGWTPSVNSYRNCIIFGSDRNDNFYNNVFVSGIRITDIRDIVGYLSVSLSIDESTRYSTYELPTETATFKGNSVALFDDVFNYTNEENPIYAPIITTITGDDGTVVGPYGGTGFSEAPSIPRITESKIDTYTNGEGKLNVKVKVEVGQ